MGGQGGCERRSEVIVKIQKKINSGVVGSVVVVGGGGGGREDPVGKGGQGGCEQRIEVIVKMPKKEKKVGGSRVGQGGGGWLVAMLGVGGDVGYWGCGPKIEGIVQYKRGGVRVDQSKELKFLWGSGWI